MTMFTPCDYTPHVWHVGMGGILICVNSLQIDTELAFEKALHAAREVVRKTAFYKVYGHYEEALQELQAVGLEGIALSVKRGIPDGVELPRAYYAAARWKQYEYIRSHFAEDRSGRKSYKLRNDPRLWVGSEWSILAEQPRYDLDARVDLQRALNQRKPEGLDSTRGHHQRYHVKRNKRDENCDWCLGKKNDLGLTDQQAYVLHEHYVADRPLMDLADEWGCSTRSVKYVLAAAKVNARRLL